MKEYKKSKSEIIAEICNAISTNTVQIRIDHHNLKKWAHRKCSLDFLLDLVELINDKFDLDCERKGKVAFFYPEYDEENKNDEDTEGHSIFICCTGTVDSCSPKCGIGRIEERITDGGLEITYTGLIGRYANDRGRL